MEGKLMFITIKIGRIIGLCNFCYDPESKRFELDGGFMLVYWVLVDLVYLLLTPCVFAVMVNSFFNCQGMDMLAVAYSAVALAKACSLLMMLWSIWLRRRDIQRFGNGLLILLKRYSRYIGSYNNWRRHFWKLLLCISRFVVLIHQLFGPGSALMCGEDEVVTRVPAFYIVLSVVALSMELVLSCTETLVYLLLDTSNCLLEYMSQEALELAHDVRWLPQYPGCHRKVYQQQLLAAWLLLWRCCMQLDSLMMQMLDIFQWQILLNLFTNYLTDITILFNLAVLFAEVEYISPWRCVFYSVLCVTYHLDIMTHYSMFGANQLHWKRLSVQIQKFWCALNLVNIDCNEDIHGVALRRQVEFAVLFLNRKLQKRPEKVRRLHIAGLFDMNRVSVHGMSSSILMNVIILCQIAYKNYY